MVNWAIDHGSQGINHHSWDQDAKAKGDKGSMKIGIEKSQHVLEYGLTLGVRSQERSLRLASLLRSSSA